MLGRGQKNPAIFVISPFSHFSYFFLAIYFFFSRNENMYHFFYYKQDYILYLSISGSADFLKTSSFSKN